MEVFDVPHAAGAAGGAATLTRGPVRQKESFDHVNDWLSEVNRYASEGTSKLLIGEGCT